jgi:hypothetical protein
MERKGEKAKEEESACSSARSAGRLGPQQSQKARQQRKWPQGRSGQKPQEDFGRQTQCAPTTAWTPQRLNLLIETIRARSGDCTIGRGDSGIRYSASTLRQDDPVERVEESGQLSFLCSCGAKTVELKPLGCCRSCYDREYRSRRLFGGLRDRVLQRDGFRCHGCGARSRLLVHHRDQRNEEELLLALCIGCHIRVHHSYGFRRWLPEMLLRLWREWHEGEPVQLQLSLESVAENVATPVRKAKCPKRAWRRELNLPHPQLQSMETGDGHRVSSTHVRSAEATTACHRRIESFLGTRTDAESAGYRAARNCP